MDQVIRDTKETVTALVIVACLFAGIGAAIFYTLGPDGWLIEVAGNLVRDPNLSTFAVLVAVIGATWGVKRLLDRQQASMLDNLLVGVVALGGFFVILQALRGIA